VLQCWTLLLVFGVIQNLLLLVQERADTVLMQLVEMPQLSWSGVAGMQLLLLVT
jgi:hypothetical protein